MLRVVSASVEPLSVPLAEPFVLGISSGAGFGVALVLAAAYALALPAVRFGGEAGGAVVGAATTLALVMWLGRARAGHDPTRLILAGVIVGSIFASATMLRMASLASASARGVAQGFAPAAARACALSGERFHTNTSWPRPSSRVAIAAPMRPIPRIPIFKEGASGVERA